jgi:hypothetical protein
MKRRTRPTDFVEKSVEPFAISKRPTCFDSAPCTAGAARHGVQTTRSRRTNHREEPGGRDGIGEVSDAVAWLSTTITSIQTAGISG